MLHAGRIMTVVRAHLLQGERRILDVTAVLSTGRPEAPRFECLTAPVAERPFESSHPSRSPTDALWTRSLEGRICVDDLDAWEATGDPEAREWIRFRSGDGFRSEPAVASSLACLVIADLLGFVAARKRFDTRRYIAPTVDIAVFFHGAEDPAGLYLCDAWARAVGDGAVSAETAVWSPGGALMATAVQPCWFASGSPSRSAAAIALGVVCPMLGSSKMRSLLWGSLAPVWCVDSMLAPKTALFGVAALPGTARQAHPMAWSGAERRNRAGPAPWVAVS